MKPHHQYELQNRIETVMATGHVSITRDELLRWFDQSRLSKTVWRDLLSRWASLGGSPGDLKVWEGDGFYSFIYPVGFEDLQKWS
jgi:hypothetical protein